MQVVKETVVVEKNKLLFSEIEDRQKNNSRLCIVSIILKTCRRKRKTQYLFLLPWVLEDKRGPKQEGHLSVTGSLFYMSLLTRG